MSALTVTLIVLLCTLLAGAACGAAGACIALTKKRGLRDYFIAHAPKEPPQWFVPDMPKQPSFPALPRDLTPAEKAELASLRAPRRSLTEPRIVAYLEERDAASKALLAWKEACVRERHLQWPLAWADAMLARRTKEAA